MWNVEESENGICSSQKAGVLSFKCLYFSSSVFNVGIVILNHVCHPFALKRSSS